MNLERPVGEINQFRRDYYEVLAEESDPARIAEYVAEFGTSEDIQLAGEVQNKAAMLINGLSKVMEAKSVPEAPIISPDAQTSQTQKSSKEYISPEDRFVRKITAYTARQAKDYKAKIDAINPHLSERKQVKARNMALKQFVKGFEKFPAKNNDNTHILNQPEALGAAFNYLQDSGNTGIMSEALTESCTQYAKDHALELTGNAEVFAGILEGSTYDSLYGEACGKVIESFFRSAVVGRYVEKIVNNLAAASIEVLNDEPTLVKIIQIGAMDAHVPNRKAAADSLILERNLALAHDDQAALMESYQAEAIYNLLLVLAPDHGVHSQPMGDPVTSSRMLANVVGLNSEGYRRALEKAEQSQNIRHAAGKYEQVDMINVPSGRLYEWVWFDFFPELQEKLASSRLFDLKMRELTPVAFSLEWARLLAANPTQQEKTDPEKLAKTTSMIRAISPQVALTASILRSPQAEHSAVALLHIVTSKFIDDIPTFGNHLAEVQPYKKLTPGSRLKMLKGSVSFNHGCEATVIARPLTDHEKDIIPSHEQLTLTFMVLKDGASWLDEEYMYKNHEQLSDEADKLRNNINLNHQRTVGQRPILFKLPPDWQRAGVDSVKIRRHANKKDYLVDFNHMDGKISVVMDSELRLHDSRQEFDPIALHTEITVLKLLNEWLCRPVMRTSEGVIDAERPETSKKIGTGHFMYLQIRQSDGYHFRYQQEQADLCLEEDGSSLAEVNTRKKEEDRLRFLARGIIDEGRNVTYVGERYDPKAPPLVVYWSQRKAQL